MAKILISSLGTGSKEDGAYRKAKYQIDKKEYETSFIADALMKHFSIDKIFIVGTKKSIWDEAYATFGGEDDTYLEELFDLKEKGNIKIESLKKFEKVLPNESKSFLVDYGLSDNELWSNFEKFLQISEHINDGDEVYLDITHSFRSLSLMSFVMTQFASSISDKNFTIRGVYYGMFEYSSDNNGITPVVDLKIFLEIQEWIKAIDAIKKYSDFEPLINVMQDAGVERNVFNSFANLNNTISMANMGAMKQFVETANKKINSIKESNNKIVTLLAPEILKLIDELTHEKMSDFQYALAKWFHRNKNYAFSYIALYEAIITKSCEIRQCDISDYEQRENAKKSIGNDRWGKYFYTKYDDSLSVIRNSIVHQSSDRQSMVKQDIEKLDNFLKTFNTYFER